MNLTSLDNLACVSDQLQSKYQVEIKNVAYFTHDLTSITAMGNVAFFGVLSLGNNTAKLFYEDNQFIEVDANTQIIELFTKIEIYDELGVLVTEDAKGLFRGYQMQYGDVYQL